MLNFEFFPSGATTRQQLSGYRERRARSSLLHGEMERKRREESARPRCLVSSLFLIASFDLPASRCDNGPLQRVLSLKKQNKNKKLHRPPALVLRTRRGGPVPDRGPPGRLALPLLDACDPRGPPPAPGARLRAALGSGAAAAAAGLWPRRRGLSGNRGNWRRPLFSVAEAAKGRGRARGRRAAVARCCCCCCCSVTASRGHRGRLLGHAPALAPGDRRRRRARRRRR
jgi:hypothetical protein